MFEIALDFTRHKRRIFNFSISSFSESLV